MPNLLYSCGTHLRRLVVAQLAPVPLLLLLLCIQGPVPGQAAHVLILWLKLLLRALRKALIRQLLWAHFSVRGSRLALR